MKVRLVGDAAADWLASAHLGPAPRSGSYLSVGARLLPDTVDRVRCYVTLCCAEPEHCRAPTRGAIAVTVDVRTGATSEVILIRHVRDADEQFHFPLEPLS